MITPVDRAALEALADRAWKVQYIFDWDAVTQRDRDLRRKEYLSDAELEERATMYEDPGPDLLATLHRVEELNALGADLTEDEVEALFMPAAQMCIEILWGLLGESLDCKYRVLNHFPITGPPLVEELDWSPQDDFLYEVLRVGVIRPIANQKIGEGCPFAPVFAGTHASGNVVGVGVSNALGLAFHSRYLLEEARLYLG